jgi:hypothetical protein
MNRSITAEKRQALIDKINLICNAGELPTRLFGKSIEDTGDVLYFVDFETENYTYFLDNVLSREDLIEGLALLSPFADDALDIAKVMSSRDFAVFKLALPKERRAALGEIQSAMPQKFFNLLVPDEFMFPSMRSKEFGVSLGVMLWRSMEIKYNVC